jgi:hypothetical protein
MDRLPATDIPFRGFITHVDGQELDKPWAVQPGDYLAKGDSVATLVECSEDPLTVTLAVQSPLAMLFDVRRDR